MKNLTKNLARNYAAEDLGEMKREHWDEGRKPVTGNLTYAWGVLHIGA
jgi:hypothetical protein